VQLPNWLKIVWWLAILTALSWFLYERSGAIIAGTAVAVDAVILVIWLALMLVPIFQEINLFGVKLKQEIKSLKDEVRQQISNLQTEIRTTVRTEVNPQFTFPYPPADTQLPRIEERIRSAVREAIQERGLRPSIPSPDEVQIGDDVQFLFAARHNIEKELRRLWDSRISDETRRRPPTITEMVGTLIKTQVIDPGLGGAIREVYSVCSPAIHGEPVTEPQVKFVRDVAPELIATLRDIV